MGRKIIGKTTIYYGSGEAAEERGGRLDEAAKRRGFVNKEGEPELSPLFVFCFEVVDKLNPGIEKEAEKLNIDPAEFINQIFAQWKKR
jgi:hypothetical protein